VLVIVEMVVRAVWGRGACGGGGVVWRVVVGSLDRNLIRD